MTRLHFCYIVAARAILLTLLASSPAGAGFAGLKAQARNAIFAEPTSLEHLAGAPDFAVFTQGLEAAVISIHGARVNVHALTNIEQADGRVVALSQGVVGQTVSVLLPGYTSPVSLRIRRLEQWGNVKSYSGSVTENPKSTFTITQQEASVLAKIHIGPDLYVLHDPPQVPGHIFIRLDKHKIPAGAYKNDSISDASEANYRYDSIHVEKTGKSSSIITSSLSENGNVRILFLYTPGVQSRNNINTLVNNIIAEFNSSLLDSNVAGNYYVTKAGQSLVNDDFDSHGECKVDVILDLADRKGVFSGIDSLMTQVHADVVVLIITTEPNMSECWNLPLPNFGRVGGIAWNFNSENPFALTTDTYALGDITASHELGHVFGGKHEDPECSNHSSGIPNTACGWVHSSSPHFQTIMGGYADGNCSFDGLPPSCERIPYWSDPNQYGDSGARMRDALQGTSGSDATMGGVAGWAGYPHSRPSAPSSLSVTSEQCFGINTVSWSSSANADHYQLMWSSSSLFDSPKVLFRGNATSTIINVSSGTWYLRVRACNGNGCSDVGQQQSASYHPGCS